MPCLRGNDWLEYLQLPIILEDKLMKENLGWICCLLLFGIFGFSYFSQNSHATAKETWEYTYITIGNTEPINSDQVNKFGQEGWEMVTILPASEFKLPTIFFKRKK
jgi:hypothetical protein